MRALLSKVLTGSMVAGAALLVAACGGGEEAEVNNVAGTELEGDLLGNDVTAVDAGTAMDANMAMDTNMSMDTNVVDANTSVDAEADATNGM